MRWLACVLLSFLVATCGQKGPLTLPEDEASETAAVSEGPEFRGLAQVAPGSARERTDLRAVRRGGGIIPAGTAGLT